MKGDDDFNPWKDLFGYHDEDGDGDVDIADVDIADYNYDVWIQERDRGKVANPDDDWRLCCKDGSDYGIDPDDYDDEDEYLVALEQARNNVDGGDSYAESDDYDADDDEYASADADNSSCVVERKNKELVKVKTTTEHDSRFGQRFASQKYYKRVDSSFLIRQVELEKELGIEDIRLYCYWEPDMDDVLAVVGELLFNDNYKTSISFRIDMLDQDGDVVDSTEIADYTGSSGIVYQQIFPDIAFNRYPFHVTLYISKLDLKKNTFRLVPFYYNQDDENEPVANSIETKSLAHIQVDEILRQKIKCAPIFVADLKAKEKMPKDLIYTYIEPYLGLTDFNISFIKNADSEDEYSANSINRLMTYSGDIKSDILVYTLFYNEDNELIYWGCERIWSKKFVNHLSKVNGVCLPPSEKIARIIVYLGAHPAVCDYGDLDELHTLEKKLFR